MASSSAPVESKAEAVASLERLEQCINEVHSRLDAQQNSRFVTRFTEKNFLTHRCMNMCVNSACVNSTFPASASPQVHLFHLPFLLFYEYF